MITKIIILEQHYKMLNLITEEVSHYEYKTNPALIKQQKLKYLDNLGDRYMEDMEMGRSMSSIQEVDPRNRRIRINRRYNMQAVEEIKEKIQRGEELPPVLLDWDWSVLDGENRLEAARQLKLSNLPIIFYRNPVMDS